MKAMSKADACKAMWAINKHCGGHESLPTTPEQIQEIERITREHRRAEAAFRELPDKFHSGVPYWMESYVTGVVNSDGSYNR